MGTRPAMKLLVDTDAFCKLEAAHLMSAAANHRKQAIRYPLGCR